MDKAVLTPLYISVAWAAMISYQLFTQVAVTSVFVSVDTIWPSNISMWLMTRIDTINFIHAFAWIFVLSSVIPSVLLGKQRGVLVQFFCCLALTLFSFWVQDAFPLLTGQSLDSVLNISAIFQNPIFAALYISAPYVLMVLIDIRSNRMNNHQREAAISNINL